MAHANDDPARPHLEWDETEGCLAGRDPRTLGADGLRALGLEPEPLLTAVRRNCIDCMGGSLAEVRRCGMTSCPLWPFRLNSNPWRAPASDAQKEAARAAGAAKRARLPS